MLCDLYTTQADAVSDMPWQVYPRPQMKRAHWENLNGMWDFAVTDGREPESFSQKIRVPFCPESLLSGIHTHYAEGSALWYRRHFPKPACSGRVLLHIGAADQIADVYVNQAHVGTHAGGYESFTFDITDALMQENTLLIRCVDDLRNQAFPYGKQTVNRGGMWYTPVSGIWQTVWLECVPQTYIQKQALQVTGTEAVITVSPALSGTVRCQGKEYPLTEGKAVITPEKPHLWSPEDPYLYDYTLTAGEDTIEGYFALRTLEIKTVKGFPRLCLNGKPYFFHGLLDQGYWSDGLYTPAAPECYAEDILRMRELGFNTLRKHIKVEPEEFYYQCDKLGMVVFQDMVNNSDYSFFRDTLLPTVGIQRCRDRKLHPNAQSRELFLTGMQATVNQLRNHPCICYWTIFNEGWGQFDSDHVYTQLRGLDDTRFIDSTSGWFRRKNTDVESLHIYFGPWGKLKAAEKPLVLSEFGGHCYRVDGHVFNPDKAYGYKTCTSRQALQESITALYTQRILPGIKKGLCGAIYTQVSDVEDEINGLLTYDRKVVKVDAEAMQALAGKLQQAFADTWN